MKIEIICPSCFETIKSIEYDIASGLNYSSGKECEHCKYKLTLGQILLIEQIAKAKFLREELSK